MDEFAERVKRLREHQGLTRRELAHRSGLHEQHLLKIEQGLRRRLEADTIIRLAKTLGVTTDYLLGMTDVNPTTTAGHTGVEGVRDTEALDAETAAKPRAKRTTRKASVA